MSEQETVRAARAAVGEKIGQAQADLVKAAGEIAEQHGLPNGINGLTAGEFLGRLSFVVSMSRDIRAAGEEYMTKEELRAKFGGDKKPDLYKDQPKKKAKQAEKLEEERAKLAPPTGDIEELALHPNIIKALRGAGVHQVGDLEKFPDEALLAVRGIAPPSLAKIRQHHSEYQVKGPLNK